MRERRRSQRHELWFPMRIETGGHRRFAVSQNVSSNGLLIATAQRLEVGAELRVHLRVSDEQETLERRARVVRVVDVEEGDDRVVWPYHVAVRFDEVDSDLEALLVELGPEP